MKKFTINADRDMQHQLNTNTQFLAGGCKAIYVGRLYLYVINAHKRNKIISKQIYKQFHYGFFSVLFYVHLVLPSDGDMRLIATDVNVSYMDASSVTNKNYTYK